ncbi:hypothetical protein QIH07_27870, partial [Klebsiella pneumoniae]|nr:hypothetical protein [Klebsiella pneumoniae]
QWVLGPLDPAQIDTALLGLRTSGYRDNPDATATPRRQGPALTFDQADYLGTHGAEARNTHLEGCDHFAENLPE